MRIETEICIPSAPDFHAIPRRTFRECALAMGLEEKVVNRLELALGEALANVVRHCYHNAPDRPIIINCTCEDDELILRITDNGPCIDPAKLPTKPTPCDQPGGLGLHLIRKVMTSVDFSTCPEGGNKLTLTYKLPSPPQDTR